MEFFLTLLVLLLVTRTGGEIAARLGQPPLAGQLVAGIVAGGVAGVLPSEVPIAESLHHSEAFTAVPVAAKVLVEIGELTSSVGRAIVGAAVIDDILSLLLLAALTSLLRTGGWPSIGDLAVLVGKVALFFAIAVPVGLFAVPRLGPFIRSLLGSETTFSGLLVLGLGYAVLAEALGLHFLVGAFLAGLFFSSQGVGQAEYDASRRRVNALSDGFLVPIFFASIGFAFEPSVLWTVPGLVAALLFIALAGKIIGACLPARLAGLDDRGAVMVGIGMSARGAVELVVADVARKEGLFDLPQPRRRWWKTCSRRLSSSPSPRRC